MKGGIHFFSQTEAIPPGVRGELLGIRGRQAGEFAELGFPILPGFILDAELTAGLDPALIKKDLLALLEKCGELVGKKYGDGEKPLLLKIVVSSNLAVSSYPSLHNFGLVKSSAAGFARWVGAEFAAQETLFLIRGMLCIEGRIRELEGKTGEQEEIAARIKVLDRTLGIAGPSNELDRPEPAAPMAQSAEACMDGFAQYFPPGFFDSAEDQFLIALGEAARLLRMDDQNDSDTALLVQPMVYGNYGKDSCAGDFFSRDPATGEDKLWGRFYRGKFNETGAEGQDIGKIEPRYFKELGRIARTLEDKFQDIRRIRFTVEKGKLWLIDQRPAGEKSARADLRLLLDLEKRKLVDKASVVKGIDPVRLNELLHPLIKPSGLKGLKKWSGGIAGAPGAAIGRVYFSAAALLEARRRALREGRDSRFILALRSSFAGDVKAIELAAGVLSVEGGYAAHASVVARQYGKVSLVAPAMQFKGKKAVLGDLSFAEGDYLTVDVPYHGEPAVYQGAAELIEPDPGESGLLDYIALCRGFVKDFHVRANADSPADAALARKFGAEGIGLCRTEHMFFKEDRINVFREMILSDSPADREKALGRLQGMQREDFYGIFKAMAGKEVTIRLLDAPLHEFMPRSGDELEAYLAHIGKVKKEKVSRAEVLAGIEGLSEFNPMLGRRGCRLAVSYPEIYAMQVRAIFEAAYKLRAEKEEVRLEIMVPVVMNAAELKLIAYGKKIEGGSYTGIVDLEEELRREKKAGELPYRIGAMIELPAAALGAGEIARYARFFSFGTNDLTQTTLGISRDDSSSFMADYTLYDLFEENPFSVLDGRVKEIIALAVERGRLVRPDLVCGLCGEHGANPANVRFCMEAGLNYVSCSSYSAPIALAAIAQAELERGGAPPRTPPGRRASPDPS